MPFTSYYSQISIYPLEFSLHNTLKYFKTIPVKSIGAVTQNVQLPQSERPGGWIIHKIT